MAEPRTIEPGTLRIATATPFPPFAVERNDTDSGFDAELMRAVCGHLGLRWKLVRYEGADCSGIFDGLRTGDFDAVVAATAITPEREMIALFSTPYLSVDQAVLVDATRSSHLTSVDDLATEVVGAESGRTSVELAQEMLEGGRCRDVRRYPCSATPAAIEDLGAGRLAALVTLAPVAAWYAREHDSLVVLDTIATGEHLGVAFAPGNVMLRDAVNEALDRVRSDGVVERLERRWMSADGPAD